MAAAKSAFGMPGASDAGSVPESGEEPEAASLELPKGFEKFLGK
jgi:hypothetical protein